jgi:hypothetical protein
VRITLNLWANDLRQARQPITESSESPDRLIGSLPRQYPIQIVYNRSCMRVVLRRGQALINYTDSNNEDNKYPRRTPRKPRILGQMLKTCRNRIRGKVSRHCQHGQE